MSTEFWGNMPKDQDDPEKPEEMAERVVQAHDDDPDAHLDEGQSLKSHRASEIIDHIARSVVGDKVNSVEDVSTYATYATLTGKGANTLIFAGQTWEIDEWAGHQVWYSTDTDLLYSVRISSNTADTLTILVGSIANFQVGMRCYITDVAVNGAAVWGPRSLLGFNSRGFYSNTPGRIWSRTITGNRCAIICDKGPDCGEIAIWVEVGDETVVDLYSATPQGRVRVLEYEWATDEERTISVEIMSYKNALSSNYYCYFNGWDVNGVVPFTSLNTQIFSKTVEMETDADGYCQADFRPPADLWFIGVVSIMIEDLSSLAPPIPVCYSEPDINFFRVRMAGGDVETVYNVTVYFLATPRDPYVSG